MGNHFILVLGQVLEDSLTLILRVFFIFLFQGKLKRLMSSSVACNVNVIV